jgi:hypothetical protein
MLDVIVRFVDIGGIVVICFVRLNLSGNGL